MFAVELNATEIGFLQGHAKREIKRTQERYQDENWEEPDCPARQLVSLWERIGEALESPESRY